MDRRRQRRPAVHAEGRQVLAAAQHQLLPLQAAGDARLVGERRPRRVPDRASRADAVLVECYSGARAMQQDEVLRYDFRLLLTPFHTLDTKAQFTTRYFHAYKPVAEAAATGANTLNIHHANDINPYINYPFLRPAQMKAYIDEAHARGLKVKIYYTVRELSNRAPELFALRSLGDEILSEGPGRRLLLAAGAPRLRLHRRLVRARTEGRRRDQHRRLALAQLLRRGAGLAREERRHRRPLHRRRGVRPDDDEARAEGARPRPARAPSSTSTRRTSSTCATASRAAPTSTSSTSRSSTASGSASTSTTTPRPTTGSSRSRASRSA